MGNPVDAQTCAIVQLSLAYRDGSVPTLGCSTMSLCINFSVCLLCLWRRSEKGSGPSTTRTWSSGTFSQVLYYLAQAQQWLFVIKVSFSGSLQEVLRHNVWNEKNENCGENIDRAWESVDCSFNGRPIRSRNSSSDQIRRCHSASLPIWLNGPRRHFSHHHKGDIWPKRGQLWCSVVWILFHLCKTLP